MWDLRSLVQTSELSTEDPDLKDSLKTFSGLITQQELSYTPFRLI